MRGAASVEAGGVRGSGRVVAAGSMVDSDVTDSRCGQVSDLAISAGTLRGFLGTGLGRAICTGGIVYAALCLAILLHVSFPSLEAASQTVAIVVVSLAGPALLLAWGIGAWKLFAAFMTAMLGCVFFAWYLYRRFPESEVFALPIFAAIAIWIGSGWFAAALAI